MGYKYWFLLVIIDAILLAISFLSKNIAYALVSLLLALFLQHSYSKVKFPKLTILGHEISDKGLKNK